MSTSYTVTGISGVGSADGKHKGPGNKRDLFVPLLSPHIVAAGVVSLSSGTMTVNFPKALPGGFAKYAVIVSGGTAATTASKTNNDHGDFVSFVINGTGTDSVSYIVVLTGSENQSSF